MPARPFMRVPACGGHQAPKAAAFLASRRRGPSRIPVPVPVWKVGRAGRNGGRRNPSVSRLRRECCRRPRPAGGRDSARRTGRREAVRPRGRPCLFRRFPGGHGGARRARRLFEAVRHRSRARRVCTLECKSGAPDGALLRGFPLPPQKQRIRVLAPVWVKLRHAASRRAHTSAVRAASLCSAAARRENGGEKQKTTA